ncbi:MAG: alpha-L-fucosidase [Chitinophagaceae bacterium]|nr:MAG: alpha-L-fucosidase [Chitinophagaceae bacterium]
MKKHFLIFLFCFACRYGFAQGNHEIYWQSLKDSAYKYDPSWSSLKHYTVPAWFRDAKFGIFIHWGVYAVPAFGGNSYGEWYPYNMYRKGTKVFEHHVSTYGTQDTFGYKDFIPMFKADKFDPDDWARLFKEAGAKYVVPVAEHHDGFAMYKTSLSRWNAVDMGPHHDIIGELAEAVRKEGMIFGLSSHRAEHWFYFYNGRLINSDVNDPKYSDFYGPAKKGGYDFPNHEMTTEFLNDWLLRCIELVNEYHPQLFWFDQWIERDGFQPYLKTFASYYYNHGLQWHQGVVINYKYNAFPDSAGVLDIERGKQADIRSLPWQSDDAVSYNSWGYIKGLRYKSAQYLIDELIDIVSKNGNLLLNIGPRADGTIPEEQRQLLLSIGEWLKVNGEAIYGTRPWVIFGEGPAKSIGGDHIDKDVKPFTSRDIRFTTKGGSLYAIVMVIPRGKITIRSLSDENPDRKIASVMLVGSNEKVSWSQNKEGLTIKPSARYPSDYAAVYRIAFKKDIKLSSINVSALK